ncbi:Tubulin polyglutamylase TTLL4 [Oryzias melastigma]|uniref:Tubulin polyglutamylase TTLL4 n=1 Tax=Oryzias melastigma TaxID=30732 RepID=A0A834C913_ORYME|nr:tubulin polyglutamylase TTLL4 [Oryzias melastigma]XP_024142223.1 tubulin polyglutamylase TTLL4 [Oryzias melastigma]KAF6723338.1 Tubulin polyglutamylase TTLL4 [Oryzias melastigma]
MLGCAMPANQSLPWGGAKLRARSSSEGHPVAAVSEVPFRIEDKRLKNEKFPPESDQNLSLPRRLEGFQNRVASEMQETSSSSIFTPNDEPRNQSAHRRLQRAESGTGWTAEEPRHLTEAADCLSSPPVPHSCLSPHNHQGSAAPKRAFSHDGAKPETRSTRRLNGAARSSRRVKTAVRRRPAQSDRRRRSANSLLSMREVRLVVMEAAASAETHTESERRGSVEDAGQRHPDQPDDIADLGQTEALVGSVTSQISAIHLTRQEQASCRSPPSLSSLSSSSPSVEQLGGEDELSDHQWVMQVDGVEEELPDELENICSDGEDSDSSSAFRSSSAAPRPPLSRIEEPMVLGTEEEREERPALVPSLFPFIPPTLYFSTANEKVELLPAEQRRLLKWKMSTVTPNVVKHTIDRSHFKVTKKGHDWLGCWGHHMKSAGFKELGEHQKLNHFPGTFQIGRKDRLWRNLSKMRLRFGKQEFSFFPRTFILPQDVKQLRKAWEDGGSRQKWIIKPPASARGTGIQVIHKWSQMPHKRPLLVQKYLHKPYLISGNKFDLRIYVYVPCYDPLRIYIFSDGLVRFASCKYSSSMKTLGNKFMHLTNYSVNKKNAEYQTNSDDKACQGHKWALKALWQFLGSRGVNTSRIWEKIKDIVIKTVIASEPYVHSNMKMHVKSPYSCHELFGFDIMLDENLKPWILEVNISPSLHSSSALDVSIKGQMIRDLLNLAGFRLPRREEELSPCSSASSSTSSLSGDGSKPAVSADERVKRSFYVSQRFAEQDLLASVLDVLTPEDVRVLAESEDELSRRGDFERIFPSPSSARYLRFFETQRYFNILLDQWEQKYWNDWTKRVDLLKALCQKRVHLGTSDPAHMWSKCSYTSRFQPQGREETSPLRPSVVVSSQHCSIDEDCLDCSSPELSPTQSLLLQRLASL